MSSKDLINLGIAPDSGTGDSARRGGAKINTLFADLYANLGDNPVGNDPRGNNYGYRVTYGEYDYKVGELHAAGRFIPVTFKSTGTLAFSQTLGWIGSDSEEIYGDSEWFFLSRGDSLGLDLRKLDSDSIVHLVLPLAVPGDCIRVRDTFNSWANKNISIWTTPYEFQNASQVAAWETATNSSYPGSKAITVSANNRISYAVPFKSVTSFDNSTYPNLTQAFISTLDSEGSTGYFVNQGTSPIYFRDKPLYEINFIYVGYETGWVCQTIAMNSYDFDNEINLINQRIIELDSDLAIARADLDSDSFHIQRIRTEADSDVAAIAQLRRDADSDSMALQQIRIKIDGGFY